jgi:recombination protein RecA
MPPVRRTRDLNKSAPSSEIAEVLKHLRKQHGENTVTVGSAKQQPWRIPSGIFEFDLATLGGLPHDRISMVHGKKHSGKTTISDRFIMGAQQTMPDQQVVKIDVEGTHESVWSSKTGVDNDQLILVEPDSGEQAIDITRAMIHTKEVSLIVVDSLAALVPIKEQEEDADKALVGLQSKLIARMLRVISAAQITERKRGHHVTVLLINQERAKIGGYVPPGMTLHSLPGGEALGYFTSLEWRMKNKENLGKDSAGREVMKTNDHAFQIGKNKLNAGPRTGEFVMVRHDDPEWGLSETEIHDGVQMLSYAKMEGWYSGTPKGGYTLEFGEYNHRTDNADDMVRALYADREFYWSLRCNLIAEAAVRQGMPPRFVNYLRTGEATDE